MGISGDAVATLVGAVIGAGAATVASIWATRSTLNSDEYLQSKIAQADDFRSREEREHEQLQQAYAPIASCAIRTSRANEMLIAVSNRRFREMQSAFFENLDKGRTGGDGLRYQMAAYIRTAPTPWEQEQIDADSTLIELLEALALARVFASKAVLSKFTTLVDSTRNLRAPHARFDIFVRTFPAPPRNKWTQEELDDLSLDLNQDSIQLLTALNEETEVVFGRLDEVRKYSEAAPAVLELIDSELAEFRNKRDAGVQSAPAAPKWWQQFLFWRKNT